MKEKNKHAIIALSVGIPTLFLGFIPLIGLILIIITTYYGVKALQKSKELNGKGKGMAIGALTCVLIAILMNVLILISSIDDMVYIKL